MYDNICMYTLVTYLPGKGINVIVHRPGNESYLGVHIPIHMYMCLVTSHM